MISDIVILLQFATVMPSPFMQYALVLCPDWADWRRIRFDANCTYINCIYIYYENEIYLHINSIIKIMISNNITFDITSLSTGTVSLEQFKPYYSRFIHYLWLGGGTCRLYFLTNILPSFNCRIYFIFKFATFTWYTVNDMGFTDMTIVLKEV